MKKIKYIMGLIFLLCISFVMAETETIYQENSTTFSIDGEWCSENIVNNTYDGNWNTHGDGDSGYSGYIYFNYTKLIDGYNCTNATWRIKDGGNYYYSGEHNLTVIDNCFNLYDDKLAFKVRSENEMEARAYWYCEEGEGWTQLAWNYEDGGSDGKKIFEEGLYLECLVIEEEPEEPEEEEIVCNAGTRILLGLIGIFFILTLVGVAFSLFKSEEKNATVFFSVIIIIIIGVLMLPVIFSLISSCGS